VAKYKNQRIWSTDRDFLQNLADEQEFYIGRRYKLDLAQGLLIIYALPQWHKKNPKPKVERDKRSEKFQRRER
jgi:hypothetical protein